MGRVTGLLSSVMDLHVRIAMQEADREKRRLIGGGVFLAAGLSFVFMACLLGQLVLLLWLRQAFALGWLAAALVVAAIDLLFAGLFLRIGGQMLKGPILPETTAGLLRTTRALTGRF
jgi:uncharacterized membrane protein YqjE